VDDPAQLTASRASFREAIVQYYKEDIEAAIDRAMVEGYTRVPDDDEFGAFYDDLARRSIAEEPW
jgi:hypothetical protein